MLAFRVLGSTDFNAIDDRLQRRPSGERLIKCQFIRGFEPAAGGQAMRDPGQVRQKTASGVRPDNWSSLLLPRRPRGRG